MGKGMMTSWCGGPKRGVGGGLGVALLTLACGGSQAKVPRYRTVEVEQRDVVRRIEATGRLAAVETQVVVPRVAGALVAVDVIEGEAVKAGAPLARLDSAALRLELLARTASEQGARAALARARAELSAAQGQLTRLKRLAARDRTSRAEVEAAEAKVVVAQAGLEQARSALKAANARRRGAELKLENATLRAPIDGVLLRVPEGRGQMVGPAGPPLFEMAAALTRLAVHVNVGEADIAALVPGQSALLEVSAFPGLRFQAEVEQVGLTPVQVSGPATYRTRLIAPNPEGKLRIGMTAYLKLDVARVDGTLAVRDAALRFRPAEAKDAPPRSRLFVLRGEELVEVPVELGVEDGAFSAVRPRAGHRLEIGESVVTGKWMGESTTTGGSQLSIGGGG